MDRTNALIHKMDHINKVVVRGVALISNSKRLVGVLLGLMAKLKIK